MNNLKITYQIVFRLVRLQILLKIVKETWLSKFNKKQNKEYPQAILETTGEIDEHYEQKLKTWYNIKIEEEKCYIEPNLIKRIDRILHVFRSRRINQRFYEHPIVRELIDQIDSSVRLLIKGGSNQLPKDQVYIYWLQNLNLIDREISTILKETDIVNPMNKEVLLTISHYLLKGIKSITKFYRNDKKDNNKLLPFNLAIIFNESRTILDFTSKLINNPRIDLMEEFQETLVNVGFYLSNKNVGSYTNYESLFSQISLELLASFTNLPSDLSKIIKSYEFVEYENVLLRLLNFSSNSVLNINDLFTIIECDLNNSNTTLETTNKKRKLNDISSWMDEKYEEEDNMKREPCIIREEDKIEICSIEITYDINSEPISFENKQVLKKHARMSGKIHKHIAIYNFLMDELRIKRCSVEELEKIHISNGWWVGIKSLINEEKREKQFTLKNKPLQEYVKNILNSGGTARMVDRKFLRILRYLKEILFLEWDDNNDDHKQYGHIYGITSTRILAIPQQMKEYTDFDKSKWTLEWDKNSTNHTNSKLYFQSDVAILNQFKNEFLKLMDETIEIVSTEKTKRHLKYLIEERNIYYNITTNS